MNVARPTSRKIRALSSALNQTPEEIVRDWAPKPLSQKEVAAEWEAIVAAQFPELGIRFHVDDVSRLFRRFGYASQSLFSEAAGMAS